LNDSGGREFHFKPFGGQLIWYRLSNGLSTGTLLPSTTQLNAGNPAKRSTAIVRKLFRQQLASQMIVMGTFSSGNLPAREGQRIVAGAILED